MASATTSCSASLLQAPAASAAASSRRTLPGRMPCCCRPALAAGMQQRGSSSSSCSSSSRLHALPLAGVAIAAGAAWLLARQDQEAAELEQDRLDASSRRPCPSCEGTGYQECGCTKWSDGDIGCSSCSGTPGYTRCRSCGGGGTAVPIRVTIPSRGGGGGSL